MQGTLIQPLVWEDPTCLRATKPVHQTTEAGAATACVPLSEKSPQGEAWALQLEKAHVHHWRPTTVKK